MHTLISSFILQAYLRREWTGRLTAASLSLDVAGFTALTEALAAHGQAGSEALADALSVLFEPLVASIHAQGGFITHFTGDGFIALFPGPEAQAGQSALAAARSIRQHLQAHAQCTTAFGAFPLTARLGVAQGEVDWGILAAGGGAPNAWYFSGPAMTGCVRAQQQANGGEVAGSEALAAGEAGPAEDQPAQGEPGRQGLPQAADQARLAEAAASFLPPALCQLTGRGEFRNAVALFLAVQGIQDREALAALMATLFELQRRHDGFLSSINWEEDQCTVVLFWGAPAAHENDVERALGFVLDAQAQVAHPIRAGITYRITYAGLVGSAERADYGCYGLGTNLAARLVAAAPWGEIWLDAATARRAAEIRFQIEPLGEQAFKGFGASQLVFSLRGYRTAAPAARLAGRLVGRQRELAQLAAVLESLSAGLPAGVIAISGEAGVGKSRLLDELRRPGEQSAAGRKPTVTWLDCPADEIRRYSLQPFRALLRTYFDQAPAGTTSAGSNAQRFVDRLGALIAATRAPGPHDAGAPALAEALARGQSFLGALVDLRWPGSLYEQAEAKARFDNTLTALQALLLAESRLRPVVLVMEDVHWLDADSQSFLHTLSRNLDGAPLAILLVGRELPDLAAYDSALPRHEVRLAPLTPVELAELARSLLGMDTEEALLRLLQERTAGNPFFVEQLLRHMQEQEFVRPGSGGKMALVGSPSLPADVRSVLIARVDRLERPVREALQAAAVLGREFEPAVLAECGSGGMPLDAVLTAAARVGMWSPLEGGRYQFQHGLLRDAVYDMQLRGRLRARHSAAAVALAHVHAADLAPYYGDLVYHYGQAGQVDQERRYARLAGERAAAQYANAEAVAYLSRALALTPQDAVAERYELTLARLLVYDLQGNRAAQQPDMVALVELAERLHDEAKQALAAVQVARHAFLTGDYGTATAQAARAVALVPGTSETAARAHLVWGQALSWQGDYPAAREHLAAALNGAQALGLGAVETNCWLNLGIVSYSATNYSLAEAEISEALRVSRQCGERRLEGLALGTLGSIAYEQGHYGAAAPLYRQSLEICRQIGDRLNQANSLGNLGNIALYQGQYDAARAYAEETLTLCREVESRYGEIVALDLLGKIARNLGDYATAAVYFEQSLQLARKTEGQYEHGDALASLGLLRHQTGDNEGAVRFCREAIEAVADLGEQQIRSYALTNLGHALAALGDLAAAADAHRDALAARRSAGEQTRALENLAGLAEIALTAGNLAQAQSHVEEILTHLAVAPVDGAEEPLRIYLACYRVLQANSDPRAYGILSAAHDLLAQRAAAISDPALQQSYLEKVPVHRALAAAGALFGVNA
jgi:predicted ATPase/class 3 adenylate cyclase